MPVTNIECQIARGQISRYVAGDRFSQEAVNQLEGHIAECPHCKKFLAERRAALQSMLGGAPSPRAVVEVAMPEEAVSARDRFEEALRQVSLDTSSTPKPQPTKVKKEKAPAAEKPKPAAKEKSAPTTKPERPVNSASFTKPALYAAALAVVVIGMNAYSKFSGSLLGPKAAGSSTFTSIAAPAANPAPAPTSTPEATTSNSTPAVTDVKTSAPPTNAAPINSATASAATDAENMATLEESVGANNAAVTSEKTSPSASETIAATPPAATPKEVAKPKPVVKPAPRVTVRSTPVRSTRRRSTRRARTPRVTRRSTPRAASGNTIKVYDAQGNPIQ